MFENQVLRGFIANIEVIPPLIVTFQFNPDSINDNKQVNYADRNAELCGNAPGKIYTGGGHRTISFDLKLHGLEKRRNALATDELSNLDTLTNGISSDLATLRSFLYPKSDAWTTTTQLFGLSGDGKRLASPPECIFGFGAKVLECVVTDITVNETQFNSGLAPVRADVSVTLVVKEESDNLLYKLNTQYRNLQTALGLQNIRIF